MSEVNQGSCYTEEEKAFYNACWECRHDFSENNKPTPNQVWLTLTCGFPTISNGDIQVNSDIQIQ